MASPAFLDRRITDDFAGVNPTYASGNTTWTLPYAVATNGSEGVVSVVRQDTQAVLTVTRPTTTSVRVVGANLSAVPVWIGIVYGLFLQFSVIYATNRNNGLPDTRGRTNLRYVKLYYENSTSFVVSVASTGRTTKTYTFAAANLTIPESGIMSIPIQSQNTQTDISILANNAGAASFSGYEWEGIFYTRVQKV